MKQFLGLLVLVAAACVGRHVQACDVVLGSAAGTLGHAAFCNVHEPVAVVERSDFHEASQVGHFHVGAVISPLVVVPVAVKTVIEVAPVVVEKRVIQKQVVEKRVVEVQAVKKFAVRRGVARARAIRQRSLQRRLRAVERRAGF